jgi:hypothetical protein
MKSNPAQPEETSGNKVKPTQTTIRWKDLGLRQNLLDHVHELGQGKSPNDQPSIDGTIQEAVRFYLDASVMRNPAKSHTVNEVPQPKQTGNVAPSGVERIEVSPEFKPWVERLLQVLNGQGSWAKQSRRALWSNLELFSQVAEPGKGAESVGSKARRVSETAVHLIREMESLREDATATGSYLEDVDRSIREIKKTAQGLTDAGGTLEKSRRRDKLSPGSRSGD